MPDHHRSLPRESAPTLPGCVASAATALGVPTDLITPIGGRTNQTWACGDHILRVGGPEELQRETLVMAAASAAVPVPAVLQTADFADPTGRARRALLLRRLPGRRAGETSHLTIGQARAIGETCGRLHSQVASAAPPQGLPAVHDGRQPAPHPQRRPALLHLDLHPLNVLVDHHGEVSGVVDWANAATGPAVLDRARTWSVLSLDPAAEALRNDARGAALVEGWSVAAGWADLPAAAKAWACAYMLQDLAGRYAPHRLQHVRDYLSRTRGAE